MNKPAKWILEQIQAARLSAARRPEWMKKVSYFAYPSAAKVKDRKKPVT